MGREGRALDGGETGYRVGEGGGGVKGWGGGEAVELRGGAYVRTADGKLQQRKLSVLAAGHPLLYLP